VIDSSIATTSMLTDSLCSPLFIMTHHQYQTGITAHPTGAGAEKLAKSALGAEKLIPTRHFDTTHDALEYLKQAEEYRDWTIIGMETTSNSVDYTQVDYSSTTGCIIVFGNEVTGIDPELLQDPEMVICQIPMFGAKNSLNVAACAPGKKAISLVCFLTTVRKLCG
jgi:tRNA(Leu) C34 or U34 (ribose-2'-O)-methylase TrmL